MTSEVRECVINHKAPGSLLSAVHILDSKGLLEESFVFLKDYEFSEEIAEAIVLLKEHELLTGEAKDVLKRVRIPWLALDTLKLLIAEQLLTAENVKFLKESSDPGELAKVFVLLNKNGLLNKEHKEWFSGQKSLWGLIDAFKELESGSLLTEKTINLIKYHEYPDDVAKAFVLLNRRGFLTNKYQELILSLKYPSFLVGTFNELISVDLLAQRTIDILFSTRDPKSIANKIVLLVKKGRVPEARIFDLLERFKTDQLRVADVLVALSEKQLLSEDCISWIETHESPVDLINAIQCLSKRKRSILTEENPGFLERSKQPSEVAEVFVLLPDYLLTQENKECIVQQGNLAGLFKSFEVLAVSGLLNQEYFDFIMSLDNFSRSGEAINFLNKAGLLEKRSNLGIIKEKSDNLSHVLWALSILYRNKLLTQENFDVIKQIKEVYFPMVVSDLLVNLNELKLLNKKNRRYIVTHKDPEEFARKLNDLHKYGRLNQEAIDDAVKVSENTNDNARSESFLEAPKGGSFFHEFSRSDNSGNIPLGQEVEMRTLVDGLYR